MCICFEICIYRTRLNYWNPFPEEKRKMLYILTRDGGLEDRSWSRGQPRDLILMASVSFFVSEVPALSTGSRQLTSVSRLASRPNLDGLGLGLGLGHPCLGLGLGLGGPGLDYNPDFDYDLETKIACFDRKMFAMKCG